MRIRIQRNSEVTDYDYEEGHERGKANIVDDEDERVYINFTTDGDEEISNIEIDNILFLPKDEV